MSIKKLNKGGNSAVKQNFIIILAAVALFVVFTLINPNFASKGNVLNMVKSLAPYAILSLGVTFVIATGGIDLSIGTVLFGSAVLAGALCKTGVTAEEGTLWLTIPIILVTGVIFGLINGFLVAKCKIAPFIATLGSMLFSRGLTAVIAEAIRGTSSAIKYPSTGWFQKVFTNFNGFPIGLVWVLVLTIICMVVMYKTKVGRYILAIGSNEEATRLSGINTVKYKLIAYVISGICAGIAAIFWSAAFPTVACATGNGMELDATAGVYIGGTSSAGGVASVSGSVIGSALLVVIRQGLNLVLAKLNLNLNATYVTYVLTGVIIVIAILMDIAKTNNQNKVKVEKTAETKAAK